MKLSPSDAKLLYAVAVKRGNIYIADGLEHGNELAPHRLRMAAIDIEWLIGQERKDPANLPLIRRQTKLLDKIKAAAPLEDPR